MINQKQYRSLLHDLKRISETLGLIKTEKNKDKRNKMLQLMQDELDKLYEDLTDMKIKKYKKE